VIQRQDLGQRQENEKEAHPDVVVIAGGVGVATVVSARRLREGEPEEALTGPFAENSSTQRHGRRARSAASHTLPTS
jgi:hypothetical protein